MAVPSLDHRRYLDFALTEARKSPPRPTNFCVGALLVSPSISLLPRVRGYTLEIDGNTHAEQCCFIKLAQKLRLPLRPIETTATETALGPALLPDTILYTTMEPCNRRSAGNATCVDRILALKQRDGSQAIKLVVCGVKEPETFVGENEGRRKLEEAGIEVLHVPGLEEDILTVATAGHSQKNGVYGVQ